MPVVNSEVKYARLTLVGPQNNNAEIALLSQGALNTDYKGSLQFNANTLAAGNVIIVRAWGILGSGQNPGNVQFKLKFPNGVPTIVNETLALNTTALHR